MWDSVDVACEYMARMGRNQEIRPAVSAVVDWAFTRVVADRFDTQDSRPLDSEVRRQYLEMAYEGACQLQMMVDAGIVVAMHAGSGQPYATAKELYEDLDERGRMEVFPTTSGLGPDDDVEPDHPWLEVADIGIGGERVVHNDVMRAVHDYFGHYLTRAPFTLGGELCVADAHLQMFSPSVHGALLNEFLGQIAWFYAGPHLRRTDGSLPGRGDAYWIRPSQRPFARQKLNLLPTEWVAPLRQQLELEPAHAR